MPCPSMVRKPITTSAARRARVASWRVLPPPERQPAQWRLFVCHAKAGCVLEVTAHTSHHGILQKEKGLLPVRYPLIVRGPLTTSAARRVRAASLRVSPPPDRHPAQWRLFVCRANAGCALEATARTSHHGLAPRARCLPPVQYSFIVRRPTETSATWRARASRSRVSPPPERQSAQRRLRACHAKAGCVLEATARTSHHALAPTKDRPFAGVVSYHSVWVNRNQRSTARARFKLACFAISWQTASAAALARVPRECRLRVRGHSSHIAPRSCAAK